MAKFNRKGIQKMIKKQIKTVNSTKENFMKTIFLIRIFDISTFRIFIPDPGAFETKKEAELYCEEHSNPKTGLLCSYEPIRIGKMTKRKK